MTMLIASMITVITTGSTILIGDVVFNNSLADRRRTARLFNNYSLADRRSVTPHSILSTC
jgi:hypothetical protein